VTQYASLSVEEMQKGVGKGGQCSGQPLQMRLVVGFAHGTTMSQKRTSGEAMPL
jgi:hypothetical protein